MSCHLAASIYQNIQIKIPCFNLNLKTCDNFIFSISIVKVLFPNCFYFSPLHQVFIAEHDKGGEGEDLKDNL